jgi:CheY-like chemotaxis protein
MKTPLLLVDDNPDACRTAAKLIRWAGDYETDIAYDGASALELVQGREYALAIIDYQLPDMNGLELFHRIRQIRPAAKAIFLTGFANPDVIDPAHEAGVLQVLAKPVDFAALIPIIDEFALPAP